MKTTKSFHFESTPNVREIIFHSISTDMNFLSWNENALDMEVELSGFKSDVEEYKPIVENHGDVMDVFFLKKKAFSISFFGTVFPSFRVLNATIKVPKGITLTAKSTSGDVYIGDVSLKAIRVTSVSGDLNITGGECGDVEAKTTSGDVKINELADMKKLEIRCISGDVSLKDGSFSEAVIHSVSGDVKMVGIDPSFERLNVKTISGDAKISFSSKPSLKVDFSTVSGKVKMGERVIEGKAKNLSFSTDKNLASIFNFKSVSGDLEIAFEDHDDETEEDFGFTSKNDETKTMLRDIMKERKATKEEISELMKTMGYSEEEIEKFLDEEDEK